VSEKIIHRGYLEEVMWGLANVLALEEHIVDSNRPPEEYIMVRQWREVYNQKLRDLSNNPDYSKTWCLVKHLLLASYHALECASAVARDDPGNAKDVEYWLQTSRVLFFKAGEIITGGKDE